MCACLRSRDLLLGLLSLPLPVLACGGNLSVLPMPEQPQQQLWLLRTHATDAGTPATLRVSAGSEPWIALEDSAALRLPPDPFAVRSADGRRWLPLSAVPGLDYQLDACAQALALDLSGVRGLPRQVVDFAGRAPLAPPFAEPGGHLSLDLQWRHGQGLSPLAGLADAGFFGAFGVVNNTLLADGSHWARLDSSLTREWPERLTRLTIGDVHTRAAGFSRVLRLGGVQWGTDFGLQPELITAPQPSLSGRAALPGTLEVYLNQLLQEQRAVEAGPFDLTQLPVASGLNQLDVVVQDELGRREVLSLPFYAAPQLLKPGLSDYSLQAGMLRQDYGSSRLGRYAMPAALGRWRSGLTSGQTFELGAELFGTQQTAGAGLSGLWAQRGVWSAQVAMSHALEDRRHHLGGWMALGFEQQRRGWSLSLRGEQASRHFARLGEAVGSFARAQQFRIGRTLGNGVASLSYVRQTRRGLDDSAATSLGYHFRFNADWQLAASATHFSGADGGTLASLNLTRRFGVARAVQFQHDQSEAGGRSGAWFQQDASGAEGLSWRAGLEQGVAPRESAALRYRMGPATWTADADRLGGQEYWRGGLATGWVWLGPDVFWARPEGGSFAVAETGLPGVALRQDWRAAGLTDDSGQRLLTGLRPYQNNRISLDETVLPLDVDADQASQQTVPRAGGGVRLRFGLAPATPQLQLRQADGAAVPAGAVLSLNGEALALPVGYEGVVLLDAREGELRARWNGGSCTAQLHEGALSACEAAP